MPATRSAAATPSDGSTRWLRAHERHRVAQRAVGIEHEAGCGRGPTRRRPARANGGSTPRRSYDARHVERITRRRAAPAFSTSASYGRVGEQDDVAGRLDRVDQRPIRLGAATSSMPPKSKPRRRVGLGKVDVVGDHLRRRARQVVEQHRVHDARPRPAAGVRLQVAQRVLVDFDERDVLAGRLRARGVRQPPVVGAELGELERAEAVRARARREQPIAAQHEQRPPPGRRAEPQRASRAEYNRCPERDRL